MTTQPTPTRILLVDDAAAVRQALRWMLEDTPGFTVVGEAADGKTAVSRCHHLAPDLVILDVQLPRLNGYAVARALKQSSHPPSIIFLTGHGDGIERERALAAGGDGFVEKSEGWRVLLAQIRSVLSQSKNVSNGNEGRM